MKSLDLENIIIILLIAIIGYMIYKRNEKLNGSDSEQSSEQRSEKSSEQHSKQESETMPLPTELKPENKLIKLFTESEVEPYPEYPYDSNLPSSGEKRSENVNEFLDEYMNYKRFGNKIEHITTDEEINAYRKSFLDFRNVTNTSSHGFDPVDEMNLQKISGLYQGGLKIKDIYDKISAKNFDTTKIDLNSMQFNERVDDYIRSNTFEYENDEVSNGGFFFNKIRGSEKRNEHYQAYP